jgi:hypothetical protein
MSIRVRVADLFDADNAVLQGLRSSQMLPERCLGGLFLNYLLSLPLIHFSISAYSFF